MYAAWWPVVMSVGAWVLGLSGLAVVAWALFKDRARGRRRCPRCWYDLKGVPGEVPELKCPECGHAVRRERALGRTRRNWRAAAAAVVVLWVPAYLVANAPRIAKQGWRGAVPTLGLIAYVETFGDEPDITKSFAAGRGGVPAMTFKSFLVMPGAAPRVRTLSEELQRRCEDRELLLVERNVIGAGYVLMYVAQSKDATTPRRMTAWRNAAMAWGLVPFYQMNWVERVWLRRALVVPEKWIRGRPLRVHVAAPDPASILRLRASWDSAVVNIRGLDNFGVAAAISGGRGSGLLEFPACPVAAECWFDVAMVYQVWPELPQLTFKPQEVAGQSVRVRGPRTWVNSCDELLPAVTNSRIEGVMSNAMFVSSVNASPDPTLTVEVFQFRPVLEAGLGLGVRVELLHNNESVGEAGVFVDPSATANLSVPFAGDPSRRASWPRGRWQLRIRSDACEAAMRPGVTRAWQGEVLVDLTPAE